MGILVFIKLLRHGEKVYSDEWFPSPMGILVFINETAKWSLEHGYKFPSPMGILVFINGFTNSLVACGEYKSEFPSPMGILVFINPTLETLAMQGLKQQFASQT